MTTLIECQRCGTEFDLDREAAAGEHADTSRCSSCGAKNDEPRPRADGGETTRVPQDADEVEVTVTVRFQFRGE